MNAGMTVKEVRPPQGFLCRSGHVAPTLFRRLGTKAPEEPTRFYQVSSVNNPETNGVYCEPCLIIANALKDQQRIQKMEIK
jgi:hypothetical protein